MQRSSQSHKSDWIIDYYTKKINLALSEKMENNIALLKYKTGNVYLNLYDFITLNIQSHYLQRPRIIKVEIYDKDKDRNQPPLLYDVPFFSIYSNKHEIDKDISKAIPTLTALWKRPGSPTASPVETDYIFPLFIFTKKFPIHFSIFITYYNENEFSTREELPTSCVQFLF